MLCAILSGCVSGTIGTALWIKTAVDGILMIEDEPTTTEYILNKATGKDCRFINVIKGEEICKNEDGKDNAELVD